MDKRQKILIVDDSEFNRDMLKEILGETYNYLEAENGNHVGRNLKMAVRGNLSGFSHFV